MPARELGEDRTAGQGHTGVPALPGRTRRLGARERAIAENTAIPKSLCVPSTVRLVLFRQVRKHGRGRSRGVDPLETLVVTASKHGERGQQAHHGRYPYFWLDHRATLS